MIDRLSLDKIDWQRLGQRLQEVRKRQEFTQKEVAAQLNIARTTLVAVEKGERKLSPRELVQLARLYSEDLNHLLRDRPAPSELAVQFKAAFRNPLIRTEETDELQRAADELQRLAENYLELEQLTDAPMPYQYPSEYDYGGISIEAAADEIAARERDRLGLGDSPIQDVRELLENDVGLRIFYLKLPSWMSGLFGYTDVLGGCIAINRQHPPERRRLSLTHEYCHFLAARQRPDVHVTRNYRRMPEAERLAEAFARRFLMPESGIKKHLRAYLKASRKENLVAADLIHLAQYYRVSFEAYVRRLEELTIIGAGTYERLRSEDLQVRKAQSMLRIEPLQEDNGDKFPYRYKLLAVTAFFRGDLTERRLADLFDTDRLGAREIVEELSGQTGIDEEGREGWMPWAIGEEVRVRV